MPYQSKKFEDVYGDIDFEEGLDNLIHFDGCYNRIYAVPRKGKCMSRDFLKIINLFGNSGGFDLILDVLQKHVYNISYNTQRINSNSFVNLILCITMPFIVYHKDFIKEYGPKIVEIGMKFLKIIQEKSQRNVR